MIRDKTWYLNWSPGCPEYDRDDTVLAVGLRCCSAKCRLSQVIGWLGDPDLVCGTSTGGHLVYFFQRHAETAAKFDVVDSVVCAFGTITRKAPNAHRTDPATKAVTFFNVLDTMVQFRDSEMMKTAEPTGGGSGVPPPQR